MACRFSRFDSNLVIMLVATLLAAVAGGKVGQRYHFKVDRVGGLQQVT